MPARRMDKPPKARGRVGRRGIRGRQGGRPPGRQERGRSEAPARTGRRRDAGGGGGRSARPRTSCSPITSPSESFASVGRERAAADVLQPADRGRSMAGGARSARPGRRRAGAAAVPQARRPGSSRAVRGEGGPVCAPRGLEEPGDGLPDRSRRPCPGRFRARTAWTGARGPLPPPAKPDAVRPARGRSPPGRHVQARPGPADPSTGLPLIRGGVGAPSAAG